MRPIEGNPCLRLACPRNWDGAEADLKRTSELAPNGKHVIRLIAIVAKGKKHNKVQNKKLFGKMFRFN